MGIGTMKRLALFAALALSGCAAKLPPLIVTQDRVIEVKVPVSVPCVSGERPVAPKPLNQQFSAEQWRAFDSRQKAAIIGRQSLAVKSYAEALNAATAACP